MAGNLWAVHGGGFYYLEKYKHSPEKIPKDLHWFKWEAYFTLLSGLALLFVVYYYNASVYMIDTSVSDISSAQAIAIGVGTIIGSWILYDLMCKSPLVKNMKIFALIGFTLIIALAYGLSMYLSARAAYIHIGALIGTIMVLNVFFVIIPSQKSMVNSAMKGEAADPSLGKKALARSIHNNYMTLPVLFIMISNHFPSTFGHKNSWLVLSALILVGVGVRHWFNLKGKGIKNLWLLPVSLLLLIAVVFYTKPTNKALLENQSDQKLMAISDLQAMQMIEIHCVSCHSNQPTSQIFSTAPKDMVFDSFKSIQLNADLIKKQTVDSAIMPLGNTTNMSQTERLQLGQWIEGLKNK